MLYLIKENNYKWINYPNRSAPKDKVLDQYLSVIQKEKDRLKRKTKSRATEESTEDPSSESESDMSMNLIDEISPNKRKKLEKQKELVLSDYEKSEKEKAYLKAIHANDTDLLSED